MYVSAKEIRDYIEIGSDTDDDLLKSLITRAQTFIETYTRRKFQCDEITSRYFEASDIDPEDPYLLHLDRDCCGIEFIKNADDADSPETIPSTDYWKCNASGKRKPEAPWHAIRLYQDSGYAWEFDTDAWIEVRGYWAYSDKPPEDIKQQCIDLVVRAYRSTIENIGEDRAVTTPDGFTLHPKSLPSSVREVLDRYVRHW